MTVPVLPMHLDVLRNHAFATTTQMLTRRDIILYALSTGWGRDPDNKHDLAYVFEEGLMAIPSSCQVMAVPAFWPREEKFGVDWRGIVHAEQSFATHGPLPVEGEVHGQYRVDAVVDRGPDRGAMVHSTRTLFVAKSDDPVATIRSTWLLRGDGGCGSFGIPPERLQPIPDAAADATSVETTPASAALLYRLNGDLNPLHADPAAARVAGFDRPILHGLCTMGIALRLLMKQHRLDGAARVSMATRFSGIFYPGETLRVESIAEGENLRFRATAQERDSLVLDLGDLRWT